MSKKTKIDEAQTPKVSKKKVAAKKKVVAKKKVAAKKKAMPAKKRVAAAKPAAKPVISPRERYEMIATMAYYRAEQRNFEHGSDQNDWLECEQIVDGMLGNR
ncbi:MAG: transcriptional regulator [endosymbiont of Seepiophila jonesi]|uniref:Transcriptional regulator n=1 Tax=endosymbiont of Lamellibrachia luymesi TaxID=2200907 RepID=A0A370DWA0_9GAMM|nr:MAG: transcriptional regulator [endosymbiont of Lamellibrachia luymesi]RDH94127.1 MAG: transcriptional regulator [endosymbiont of Seepiophila jonesi]